MQQKRFILMLVVALIAGAFMSLSTYADDGNPLASVTSANVNSADFITFTASPTDVASTSAASAKPSLRDASQATGMVRVTAKDEEGNPAPGVKFGIFSIDTSKNIDLLYSDEYGIIEYTLPKGDYVLYTMGDDGYKYDSQYFDFSIAVKGEIIEFAVNKVRDLATINIYKYDGAAPGGGYSPPNPNARSSRTLESAESYKPLAGAVFAIYDFFGIKHSEVTTDADGFASCRLPSGSYYVKEIVAPEGYVLLENMMFAEVWSIGDVAELHVSNEKAFGRLRVVKIGEGGEPLAGVTFDVYKESTGNKECSIITGDDGTVLTDELQLGRYYLVETQTAEGYELPSEKLTFTLAVNGKTEELIVRNYKVPPKGGNIKLTKVAQNSNKPLPGAVFDVYDMSDSLVARLATGLDGTAVSGALPAGEYYLSEIVAPAGYELNDERISVVVMEDKTIEMVIANTLIIKVTNPEEILKPTQTPEPPAPIPAPIPTATPTTSTPIATPTTAQPPNATPQNDRQSEATAYAFPVIAQETPSAPVMPEEIITIPKTGEIPPYANYFAAALCGMVALMCGLRLTRVWRRISS